MIFLSLFSLVDGRIGGPYIVKYLSRYYSIHIKLILTSTEKIKMSAIVPENMTVSLEATNVTSAMNEFPSLSIDIGSYCVQIRRNHSFLVPY